MHPQETRVVTAGVKMKTGLAAKGPLPDFIPFNPILFFSQYFKNLKAH